MHNSLSFRQISPTLIISSFFILETLSMTFLHEESRWLQGNVNGSSTIRLTPLSLPITISLPLVTNYSPTDASRAFSLDYVAWCAVIRNLSEMRKTKTKYGTFSLSLPSGGVVRLKQGRTEKAHDSSEKGFALSDIFIQIFQTFTDLFMHHFTARIYRSSEK